MEARHFETGNPMQRHGDKVEGAHGSSRENRVQRPILARIHCGVSGPGCFGCCGLEGYKVISKARP